MSAEVFEAADDAMVVEGVVGGVKESRVKVSMLVKMSGDEDEHVCMVVASSSFAEKLEVTAVRSPTLSVGELPRELGGAAISNA